jgi:hypothetical protein
MTLLSAYDLLHRERWWGRRLFDALRYAVLGRMPQ